ncbi:MAG: RDD family protein [Acetobacteraceae bacterium]
MSGTVQMVRDEDFIAGVITRRCLAWVVDLVLIGLILSVSWVILFLFGLLTLGLGFGAMAVLPVVPFLYHFLSLLRSSSATPGQALFGLTVRRDQDLGPPTGLQALIFTVVFYLTMATSGLLLLVAIFTVRHRTLHDLASDLVVVRRPTFDAWRRQASAA